MQDTEQVRSDSEIVQTVKGKTSVHLELLETDDPRAAECPAGQRLLRVAGGRDQVGGPTLQILQTIPNLYFRHQEHYRSL